ncbi:MAG: ATP-binding cassette domain-containing protein, partial [Coriobacteriia bacterium]|nr:ATP-binding cassette domain-containing protein [Coriobacteriia bacterium]
MQLVFDRVSYRYLTAAEDLFALHDISLEVNTGDFLGVIGHSGSGKSTLIQLAAALIQPTEGRV